MDDGVGRWLGGPICTEFHYWGFMRLNFRTQNVTLVT